ncbi:MAG: hypothetical protein COB16_11300 [Rhodobacteraceae bacterium]|nr:MAG: hypothetical protein COB16_11300 [Paracoccaceae bacterium]
MSDRKIVIRQKTFLLACSLLATLWYVSFFWDGRPVKLIGAPKVSYIGIGYDKFNYELHQRTAFFESLAMEADATVVVVMNWDQLDDFEGLRELCGDDCSDDSGAVLVRENKLANLFSYQKFVFVRIGEFATPDSLVEGNVDIPDEFILCLLDGLAKEIEQVKYLNLTDGCFAESFVEYGDESASSRISTSSWSYYIGI